MDIDEPTSVPVPPQVEESGPPPFSAPTSFKSTTPFESPRTQSAILGKEEAMSIRVNAALYDDIDLPDIDEELSE